LTEDQNTKEQRLVDPNPTSRARELRRDATPAEKLLWKRLRNQQVGFKFRRQCPLGPYFADLCCKEQRLVVELDGDSDASDRERDAKRTEYLTERGYRVVRFWNDEVLTNVEGVLEEILAFLKDPHRRAKDCSAASP
jgi:very-short-patch-repair endonuclease